MADSLKDSSLWSLWDGLAHGVDRKPGILGCASTSRSAWVTSSAAPRCPWDTSAFQGASHGLPVRNEVVPIVLLGQRPPAWTRRRTFRIDEIRNDDPRRRLRCARRSQARSRRAGTGPFTDIGHGSESRRNDSGREQRVRVKHQIDEIVVPEELVKRVDALQRGSPSETISRWNCRIADPASSTGKTPSAARSGRQPRPVCGGPSRSGGQRKGGHTHLRMVGGASRRIASVENRGRSADRPRATPLPDRPGTEGTA